MTFDTIATGTAVSAPNDDEKLWSLARKYHTALAEFDYGMGNSFAAFRATEEAWDELQAYLRENFQTIFVAPKEVEQQPVEFA